MNFICALVLLFAALKEIWLILNQGKLETFTAIAGTPENERTKEQRDIVISIGLMLVVALVITLATLATLIGLMSNEKYLLPASMALGFTIVKFGAIQVIPKLMKPAYMVCNSITVLALYGWIVTIMFFS